MGFSEMFILWLSLSFDMAFVVDAPVGVFCSAQLVVAPPSLPNATANA